jgi:hypothetical protein
MWAWLVALAGGLALVSGPQAPGAAKALPADLAKVPAKTTILVSLRPADLWATDLGKGLRSGLGKGEGLLNSQMTNELGGSPAEVERLTIAVRDPRFGALFFVRRTKKFEREALLKKVVPGARKATHSGQDYWVSGRKAVALLGEQEFVMASEPEIQSFLESKPGKLSDRLARAVDLAAEKHSLVISLDPSSLPIPANELPPAAEPFKPLLKATAATLQADLGPKTTARLVMAFDKANEAAEGVKALEAARKMGQGMLAGLSKLTSTEKGAGAAAMVELLGQVQETLKNARPKQDGKTVTASVEMKIDMAKAGKAAAALGQKARIQAARMQSTNNLKQLGLAMHNYLTVGMTFPPRAVFDKDGKALLSWRVLLLPYLGENDLYKKFKLDEPWNSPHNKKLLAKMPKVYQAPGGQGQTDQTYYLGLSGKGCVFDGKRGIGIRDITDGTSNTLMIVEGGKSVPWTKPDDVDIEEGKPLPKLGGLWEEGFYGAIADGSVRFFKKTIKESTLRLYIIRNDGMPIPNDE